MKFFSGYHLKRAPNRIETKVFAIPIDHETTLNDLKIAQTACIINFYKENEAIKKVEAMGLRCGENVVILQKLGRGIVVKTNNSRIVLTTDVAENVRVK
ncbi:MAG TPA: FeoA family protein [Balneolales bacterium]|nr:FeoA family protein [Balneolales bacterium]